MNNGIVVIPPVVRSDGGSSVYVGSDQVWSQYYDVLKRFADGRIGCGQSGEDTRVVVSGCFDVSGSCDARRNGYCASAHGVSQVMREGIGGVGCFTQVGSIATGYVGSSRVAADGCACDAECEVTNTKRRVCGEDNDFDGGECYNSSVSGAGGKVKDSYQDSGSQDARRSTQEDARVVNTTGKLGRWAAVNKKKREKQKRRKLESSWRVGAAPLGDLPEKRCETILSQSTCPSYGQALSDAEREARESLAKRRAAENAVAEKLAKMKLESLEDEQKCQEYAELKRQRVIQWTNEATAKSQQSLDKCKSIDPASSASQYEIRKQAKRLSDLEVEHKEALQLLSEYEPMYAKILADRKPMSTASMEGHIMDAEFLDSKNDVDYGGSEFDLPLHYR